MIRKLKAIMYKPFRGLKWWEKIIGVIIFIPVVCPIVFYKMFITKDWKGSSGELNET